MKRTVRRGRSPRLASAASARATSSTSATLQPLSSAPRPRSQLSRCAPRMTTSSGLSRPRTSATTLRDGARVGTSAATVSLTRTCLPPATSRATRSSALALDDGGGHAEHRAVERRVVSIEQPPRAVRHIEHADGAGLVQPRHQRRRVEVLLEEIVDRAHRLGVHEREASGEMPGRRDRGVVAVTDVDDLGFDAARRRRHARTAWQRRATDCARRAPAARSARPSPCAPATAAALRTTRRAPRRRRRP